MTGVLLMVSEGVETARDIGNPVRNGLKRYRDAFRTQFLIAEKFRWCHARQRAAHLRGIFQVLHIPYLVGVGTYQFVRIKRDDLLGM